MARGVGWGGGGGVGVGQWGIAFIIFISIF